MTTPGPAAPQEHTPAESYEIPEAEKIAAQWEARHDLAARGGAPDPMHVQHYLAQLRSEESLQHAARPHEEPAPARVPAPRSPVRPPAAPPASAEADHGGWRRWFRHAAHV